MTYTKQEAFETAWKALKNQPSQSVEYDETEDLSSCVYVSKDGKTKCAVGHLLTDSELEEVLSRELNYNTGANEVVCKLEIERLGYLPEEGRVSSDWEAFLSTLQALHDDHINWKEGVGFSPTVKNLDYFFSQNSLTLPSD